MTQARFRGIMADMIDPETVDYKEPHLYLPPIGGFEDADLQSPETWSVLMALSPWHDVEDVEAWTDQSEDHKESAKLLRNSQELGRGPLGCRSLLRRMIPGDLDSAVVSKFLVCLPHHPPLVTVQPGEVFKVVKRPASIERESVDTTREPPYGEIVICRSTIYETSALVYSYPLFFCPATNHNYVLFAQGLESLEEIR